MIYPISPHALVHTPLPVKRKIKLPGRGACFSKSFLRFEDVNSYSLFSGSFNTGNEVQWNRWKPYLARGRVL